MGKWVRQWLHRFDKVGKRVVDHSYGTGLLVYKGNEDDSKTPENAAKSNATLCSSMLFF
jgi:hypothetical protein